MATGALVLSDIGRLTGLVRRWRAVGEGDAVVVVDGLVVPEHERLDRRILAERRPQFLEGVAKEASLGGRWLDVEPVALRFELGELAPARVDGGRGAARVTFPAGDLDVQVVNTAREIVALARELDPRAVGERDHMAGCQRLAHVQIEHGDALKVVARLQHENVAYPFGLRCARVAFAVQPGGAHDDGRQRGDRVGDPLCLAAADCGQRHQDVRALLLRRIHTARNGFFDVRRALCRGRLAEADEPHPDPPDVTDDFIGEGRRAAPVDDRRRRRRLGELRQPTHPMVGPIVHAGGERGEAQLAQHVCDGLRFGLVLVGALSLELFVHEKEGSRSGDQRRRCARVLAFHPCSEVVQPPQLVLRAPTRLEGPRQVAHQVKAHRGRPGVRSRRPQVPRGSARTAPFARREPEREYKDGEEQGAMVNPHFVPWKPRIDTLSPWMSSGENPPPRGVPRPLSGGPVKFGPYWLDARLAVGGTAEVYVARPIDPKATPRKLIVKRLLPHFASDPEGHTMFEREAALHASVHHENVVRVYASVMAGGEPWLAMELIDGCDLYRLLRRVAGDGKRLASSVAAYIARQVLSALSSVHQARDARGLPMPIVHRDVTPSNIYLSVRGDVKLGDFGIARANRATLRSAESDMLKGKLAYLAAEQVAGEPFDSRAEL